MTNFPKFAGKYASPGFTPVNKPWGSPPPYRRETPRIPSLNAADTTHAAKRDTQRYTGDQCLGVAVMHKSNLVPVFSQAQAVDTATMRRS